jgi:hypothetical protein
LKRSTWAFFGLVALALAFRALDALQHIGRRLPTRPPVVTREPPPPGPTRRPDPPLEPDRPPTPPPAAADDEPYKPHVAALHEFERRDGEWSHTLTYAFLDHHGRRRQITCDISRSDHEWQVTRYGIDETFDRARRAAFLARLEEEGRRYGLDSVLTVEVAADGAYQARTRIPPGLPDGERETLLAGSRRFFSWFEDDFPRERDRIEAKLYAERGILMQGDVIEPHHEVLAARAARPLADCFRALERATAEGGPRHRLGAFLAFLQEIPYEQPPARFKGRDILGLYVPTEVLVGRHGDCDSKAVTFAALWRNLETPVLLISLPRHMLVGVAVPPGPGEHYVQLGNRYFVLCEVAGPGKLHPGREPIPGGFEYVLLEPAASGRGARRGRAS